MLTPIRYDKLDNQIVCFPFKDHHAPPLHIMFQIINNLESWLKANPQHVAIVHCIGGKVKFISHSQQNIKFRHLTGKDRNGHSVLSLL